MSIYEFKTEDAERFAQERNMRTKKVGDELFMLWCPYCSGNRKDKYSFSINMKTGQFDCKRASCGAKGNMITLSRDFNFSLGRDVDAYYATADYSNRQYKKFKDAHRSIEVRDPAIKYLQSRGISEEVCREYEITVMPDKPNVLVFPFKDENGEMQFVKYRNTEFKKGETKGSKEWSEASCKPILFGMAQAKKGTDRLVITEGQIDSLSCATANIVNAVSVPTGANGFTWVPYCWDFVSQFKSIVVFGDCENGKITLAEEIAKRWGDKVKIVRIEDYKGCKDANEILQKHGLLAVQDAVNNATPIPDPHIKPLSKVRRVDILKIPAIKTEIEEIDACLDGGFHLGQLAVLTGKRGEGKSTIASMFGVRALDQNYKCFFYSGELVDFYFKNWMDCQITGKDAWTQSEDDCLAKWYGDKAYIHDNSYMAEDELISLVTEIERAIVRYGCQFILVDNLMTAIDDDLTTDLYRAQSKFVGNLAALAKRYEVFILLIAHPRKQNGDIKNDDVAGSSNITDKADIVMVYGRPPEPTNKKGEQIQKQDTDTLDDKRELKIIKNRLTGKLRNEKNPISLTYDVTGSRRIAKFTKDFFKIKFDWMDENIYDMTEGFGIVNEDAPF